MKRIISFTGVGLALFLLIGFGYQASFKLVRFLPPSYQSFLAQAHFKVKTAAANIIDAFYPKTYWYGVYASKLKTINLLLSPTDIVKLETDAQNAVKFGYNDKQTASNQQVTLWFEGNQYLATISIHGGGANDFVFNKNDYNVKIDKNKNILGLSSFNLFNPSIHGWLVPLLANRVAAELNLYYNDQFPILVKINNKTSGVYLLEEKINEEFLTKRGLEGAQVIRQRDETRLPHRVNPFALNAHILSGLDLEIANADLLTPDDPATLYRLNQFYQAIKNRDMTKISGFIDLDYWARYDAYRELLAVDHDTSGANLIMLFSPDDQKFYPVVRSESDLNQLSISDGTTLKSFNNYDPHLAEQYDYPRIFLLLNRDQEFRFLKYRYLYQLISQAARWKQEFQAIYDQQTPVFLYDTSDEASVWEKQKIFRGYRQTLDHNFNLIKQELAFAQAAVNVINEGNRVTVEIIPDAVTPIDFDYITLKFADWPSQNIAATINQKLIMAEINQEFKLVPTIYKFSFNLPAVTAVEVKARNKITGEPINLVVVAIASNQPPTD